MPHAKRCDFYQLKIYQNRATFEIASKIGIIKIQMGTHSMVLMHVRILTSWDHIRHMCFGGRSTTQGWGDHIVMLHGGHVEPTRPRGWLWGYT